VALITIYVMTAVRSW